MKFCSNCGAKLEDGVKFCTECGTKLLQPEPPAAPAYEPPVEPVYEIPTPPPDEPPIPTAYEAPASAEQEVPAPPEKPTYIPQPLAKGGAGPEKKPKEKKSREKKPINKNVLLVAAISVAAVLVIVLLASLLGGKVQGTASDWGRYEAVSADGEWIELEKKGKATLYIMDNEFKAKWTLNGEQFTLEQSGDTFTGTLKNGVLRIDLVGENYVFAKEGAETGPVTYKAIACISAGQILDEELMDGIGGCYLVLNGDGSGKLHLFGEVMPITYTDTAVMLDGETMAYTWKGDTMVLNFADGSSFDLVVTDEDPADAALSEFDWETGEWEETDMEAELLSYLQWPGQTFSELDLTDATLSLRGTWGEATVWFKSGTNGSVVDSMNFYVESGSYDDLRELLVSAYGEPTDEGEEPYAESNGGSVLYCWFDYPAGTLRLIAASEYDFVEIMVNTN